MNKGIIRCEQCHSFLTFVVKQFRFTLLCYAACEAPLVLPLGGFTYGEKCIFIANDWHAGLVPVYVAIILVIFHKAIFVNLEIANCDRKHDFSQIFFSNLLT